jgi:hypothetical protein
MVEFDALTTAVAFVALIAVGLGGLLASGMMTARTTLMMVGPSMVIFGLLCLTIGAKFGEHRAAQ